MSMNQNNTTWCADDSPSVVIAIEPPPTADVQTIRMTLDVARRTGFRFNLDFLAPDAANCYRVEITVEWAGQNTIYLPISRTWRGEKITNPPVRAVREIGQPCAWGGVRAVRFSRDEPARGDKITLRAIEFSERVLPRPVNPYEDLLESFFLHGFWHPESWTVQSNLPAARRRLELFWFWAHAIMEQPAAGDWISIERQYPGGIPLADYESVIALVSLDKGVACEIALLLEGAWVTAGHYAGISNFDELVAPTGGARRLDGVRLRMTYRGESMPLLTGNLSWIMLRRKGADPLRIRRHGGCFAALPATRPTPGKLEEEGLEIGLYLSGDNLPALRAKAGAGLGQAMWDKIKAAADLALKHDPEPFIGEYLPIRRGESLTRGFVEEAPRWGMMMSQLGLAYLVTGEEKYAWQCKRIVLAACRCAEWGTAFIDRFPAGIWGYRAPFFPAHTAGEVATAADMISNHLSKEEREFIDRALIEKGLFWIEAYLDRADYCRYINQGVVFAANGILAALMAERRHPAVRALREKLTAYMLQTLDNYLDEDGASGEGPAYWSYTIGQAITALLPIARVMGRPVRELLPEKFRRTIEYPLYLRSQAGADGALLNLGDAGYGGQLASPILLFFARDMQRLEALTLWQEQYGRPGAAPDDALSFLLFDPQLLPAPVALSLSKHLRGTDRIFWRSGWRSGDTLFLFESGKWGPDHHHFDKHQFLLEAFGERIFIDRGMCDYSNPLSTSLHYTWCHNTVTVDRKDQASRSRQPAATLEALEETDTYRYLCSEAGLAYNNLRLFRREVLFVRSRYFVLADEIDGIDGKLEWHFHCGLPPERTEDGFLLRGKRGDLIFRLLSPEEWHWQVERLLTDVDLKTDPAMPASHGSDYHLAITPAVQNPRACLLAVLFPVAAGEGPVVIDSVGSGEERRLIIRYEDVRDELLLKPGMRLPERLTGSVTM